MSNNLAKQFCYKTSVKSLLYINERSLFKDNVGEERDLDKRGARLFVTVFVFGNLWAQRGVGARSTPAETPPSFKP